MTNTKLCIFAQDIKKVKHLSNVTLPSQKKNSPEYNPGTIILSKEKQLDCQELKKN